MKAEGQAVNAGVRRIACRSFVRGGGWGTGGGGLRDRQWLHHMGAFTQNVVAYPLYRCFRRFTQFHSQFHSLVVVSPPFLNPRQGLGFLGNGKHPGPAGRPCSLPPACTLFDRVKMAVDSIN